jgi:hypothetical protein
MEGGDEEEMKKIEIELTEKQEHFLKLFAKNQYPGSKDNVCTNKPIHAVQTQRSRVAAEGYNEDKIVYVVNDWDYMEFDTDKLHELVKEYYENDYDECNIEILTFDEACNDEDFIDINGEYCYVGDEEDYLNAYGIPDDLWVRQAIEYFYEDVAYFYTLQSAKEYLQYQSHNLNNPRTYTKSGGYDNRGEYEHFWNLLMSLGVKLNESEVAK